MINKISIGNSTFDLTKIKAIQKKDDKSSNKIVDHLFKHEKYLNGTVDGKLDVNELIDFIEKLDTSGDGIISPGELEVWRQENLAVGNTMHNGFVYDDLVKFLEVVTDTKNNDSAYDKFEKRQVEAFQETSKASLKSVTADKEAGQADLDAIKKDNYRLYKITPDGYMDTKDADKKKEAYTKAVTELAQGMLDKYSTSKKGYLNLDEYVNFNKKLQTAIDGGKTPKDKMNATLNSDEMKKIFETAFKNADNNGDGLLSKEEIAACFAFMDVSATVYDEKMNKLDIKDGGMDGRVNLFADGAGGTPEETKTIKERMAEIYKLLFGKR